MKCPFCGDLDSKVSNSRPVKEGSSVRRRRECLNCKKRFTTYETVEDLTPFLIKKDGRREAFDRNKIRTGILRATQKRPVSVEDIDSFIDDLERNLQDQNLKEFPASMIGEQVVKFLRKVDPVAYVRFASVYKQFKDLEDFNEELKQLANKKIND